MTRSGNVSLRYWHWWCLLGVAMVSVVVYLSLADINLPQLPSTLGDKINHLIAYGVLMGWFGQLFTGWRHRILMGLILMILGVSMEFLQGITDHRFFEWRDALANSLGVLAGLVALGMGADKILKWFEKRYFKQ